MKSPLRILYLEDNPEDATLVQSALEADGIDCSILRVDNREDFVAALKPGEIDVVFADFTLPRFDGLTAMATAQSILPGIPVILVSGTLGEERAIDSLKSGATDYVLKERLSRLAPAVRRAMREVEEREKHAGDSTLIRNERRFTEATLNSLPGIFYLYDQQGNCLRWNANLERVTGYNAEEIGGMKPTDFFTGDDREQIAQKIEEVFEAGQATAEARLAAKDGTRTPYYFTAHRIQIEGKPCLIGTGLDISSRKKLEAQFIEAQKMEVIGQLAAGVAHDFNNILAVIMGYSDLMMRQLGVENPLQKLAEEILQAARRAARLTRQLLVFSCKQAVQPFVLNLNSEITDLDKMLRRLIDENIVMEVVLEQEIGHIKIDPGHVVQVLMNLVVNSRDAMPTGGTLTITTSNVTVDQDFAKKHPAMVCGDYVILSVRDTGAGMTEEVRHRLFEPFFTTKPRGKGTGLGLATCHTIVEQSGGCIEVSSNLGWGTTFNVYFPRVEEPVNSPGGAVQTREVPRGTEILLLVEDDPSLRHLACKVLEAQGYTVLRAINGQEGLRVATESKGHEISLVITDVVMPQMGGKVMAEWLRVVYPDVKILFTSGYSDEAIAQNGALESGVAFLAKPYTPAALAHKVREMLDAKPEIAAPASAT